MQNKPKLANFASETKKTIIEILKVTDLTK
jgi:hypothetical protein